MFDVVVRHVTCRHAVVIWPEPPPSRPGSRGGGEQQPGPGRPSQPPGHHQQVISHLCHYVTMSLMTWCFTWYIQYTACCHLALQAAAGGEVEVGVEEAECEGAVAEQPGQRQQPPPPPARPSCRGQVRYTGEMLKIFGVYSRAASFNNHGESPY